MQIYILTATSLALHAVQATANSGAMVSSGLVKSFINVDLSKEIQACITNEDLIEAKIQDVISIINKVELDMNVSTVRLVV